MYDTRLYDNGGRLISSSYNNGVSETRSYNDDNTLASISYSGAAIGDLGYSWDANKNKTSETIGGVMSGYGFTAGYDAEDRLTSWDRADASLDQSWDLSPVGDWNSISVNSAVQNRTHGPVHEILTAAGQAVQHDPKGNMTLIPPALRPDSDPLKLTWDFDNKLRAADADNDGIDNIFYRWDALGRRVGRDDGTSHVIYFQDGQQTLVDYPAGAAASSPAYTYVYGSYIDEVILRNEGGGTRYYHRNQQYSITALTDGGGSIVERYAYTAYGQVTFADASGTVQAASASHNRYTYTGREWDAGLSLYHYRARMYDAVAGRFISRDPIGYWDGLSRYSSYFAISSCDPYGLFNLQNFVGAAISDINADLKHGRMAVNLVTTPVAGTGCPCLDLQVRAEYRVRLVELMVDILAVKAGPLGLVIGSLVADFIEDLGSFADLRIGMASKVRLCDNCGIPCYDSPKICGRGSTVAQASVPAGTLIPYLNRAGGATKPWP